MLRLFLVGISFWCLTMNAYADIVRQTNALATNVKNMMYQQYPDHTKCGSSLLRASTGLMTTEKYLIKNNFTTANSMVSTACQWLTTATEQSCTDPGAVLAFKQQCLVIQSDIFALSIS